MGAAVIARSGGASVDPAAAAVVSAPATSAHAIVTMSVACISAKVNCVRVTPRKLVFFQYVQIT
jgi:hypothetical protein